MSREKNGAAAVPDLVLERYRLDEMPPSEAEALAQRLQSDEGLRRRLAALEQSDAEIRRRYPSAWLADRVRGRLPASRPAATAGRRVWFRHWPVPAAVAVAATVLLVLAPRVSGPPGVAPGAAPPSTEASGERIKGLKPALSLFRKTAEGSEALADGDVARAGDLLRLGYRAAGRRYGVILSLDGRGAVTLHLPAPGRQAAPLRSGEVVLLEQAYELDDAPGWERFFFVTAESPFDVAPVVDAARRQAGAGYPPVLLDLAPPLEQTTFSLEKGKRP